MVTVMGSLFIFNVEKNSHPPESTEMIVSSCLSLLVPGILHSAKCLCTQIHRNLLVQNCMRVSWLPDHKYYTSDRKPEICLLYQISVKEIDQAVPHCTHISTTGLSVVLQLTYIYLSILLEHILYGVVMCCILWL